MDGMRARDEAGNTSLHAAVRGKDADAVKSLLEAGSNSGVANKAGETPLHLAAAAGDLRIAKLLAAASTASINQHGPEGQTPLHLAVQSGSFALVQTLCESYGADISCQSNDGETPAQLANRVLGADSSVSRYLESTMYSLPAI
jgi:ankyrin repeat protein